MDQLLQIINELNHPNPPYPDAENRQLAAYLQGQLDFTKIQPFLRINKQSWHFPDDKRTRKIARDVAADKENMLPALGRFFRIAKHVRTEHHYIQLFNNILKDSGLPIDEIYMASGQSIDDLLRDILSTLQHYWYLNANVLGYESYTQFFTHIYNTYPDALEKLARDSSQQEYAIFANAYLYAKNSSNQLEDRLISLCAPLLHIRHDDDAFKAAHEEPYFAGHTAQIEALRRRAGDKKSVNSKPLIPNHVLRRAQPI